jgi:cellulose synthase/poly-beta-1,6-N-acetylglucosamine synthase-like glycosyltransferase
MAKAARFAIVTPYYKEPRALVERCIASLKGQTVTADHILVADGVPQSWMDIRHIKLDQPHRDYGNVVRGTGALLAAADAYDGIGFLDADNFLDSDHVQLCVAAGRDGSDFVVAKRRFVRPDGSDFHLAEGPGHIDTSCW